MKIIGVQDVILDQVDATAEVGSLHRHEKRFGHLKGTRSLSCAIYRCTPIGMVSVKPLLLYEMRFQYCIVCAAEHWVLGDRIEEEKPARIFQRMEITGYE